MVGLKVMTYNTWGIPHTFGSKDKEERMEKIGHLLGRGDYDLVLLEELWMRPDHETIKSSLGPEFYMTEYDDLNKCQGTIWPWGCSGLAIISRYNWSRHTPHTRVLHPSLFLKFDVRTLDPPKNTQ